MHSSRIGLLINSLKLLSLKDVLVSLSFLKDIFVFYNSKLTVLFFYHLKSIVSLPSGLPG